ncbi:MAG: hypothetical protein J0I20_14650 [Chloroflexi bacterium]|nr:hypothetical protein [Chloroflexota bacterium]
MAGAPPGSTIDAECAPVYHKIKTEGFVAHRLMAEDGFTIEKALFVNGQQAKSRYDAQLQVPDDARLCYVLVRGNIEVGSPFTTTVAIYPTGNAIYDLQTMSYLLIGTGEKY